MTPMSKQFDLSLNKPRLVSDLEMAVITNQKSHSMLTELQNIMNPICTAVSSEALLLSIRQELGSNSVPDRGDEEWGFARFL